MLTKLQQDKLLKISRNTLELYFKTNKLPKFSINDKDLNQKSAVFVTLHKSGQLRGCIGEFDPSDPLSELIKKKTLDAALHDPRFMPLSKEELSQIKIEISVLSEFKKITSWQEINPLADGVFLKLGNKGATFLPQVFSQTGWGVEEFLSHLADKAGLPKDSYKDPRVELNTYTACVFSEN